MISATAVTTSAQTSKPPGQNLQTIKIKVTGITCKGDCKDIQESVAKLSGVTATSQIGKPSATSVFEITFNPALVTEKQIQKSALDMGILDQTKENARKVLTPVLEKASGKKVVMKFPMHAKIEKLR